MREYCRPHSRGMQIDEQRERLVAKAAGHLKAGVSEPIQDRAFEYWRNIDTDIGNRIEQAVKGG